MKSFAVLCAFALLGICLALGSKCKGKDPKIFEGLSKQEIALICGDESPSQETKKEPIWGAGMMPIPRHRPTSFMLPKDRPKPRKDQDGIELIPPIGVATIQST
ncbi:unnamed protein product [Heligmosomoides polygyrus]|uniref:Kininogen-1 n=1 Tax=Heligmosomoides polygyrus TaxID=6339 RepID=A0A183FUK7_HELPZ|nr:unnamed protein product [Heligmosomoides polygyrus]